MFPDTNAGGPAKFAYDLSNNVQNPTFNMINLASNPFFNKKEKRIISQNFKIYRLPVKGLNMHTSSKLKQLWFSLKFTFYSIIYILRIHRKNRIALIHADSPAITGLPCLFFYYIFRIPFIFTYHGVDFNFRLEMYFYKLINSKAWKIIVISRRIKQYFGYLRWNFSEKTIFIPLGIQIPKSPNYFTNIGQKSSHISELKLSSFLDANDYIIIYVGRMIFQQKVQGMIDFLKAFEIFLSDIPKNEKSNYKLLFIGDGKFRNLLNQAYNKCSIKSNVKLLGFQSNIEKFYAIADLSVLVSYVEGFPNVILESLAAGVPCLCSSVGEMKEMVGNAGYIVKPGNIDEIIQKLQDFFNPSTNKNLLSILAFNRAKDHFNWNKIASNYRKLYLECIVNEKTSKTLI